MTYSASSGVDYGGLSRRQQQEEEAGS